MKTYSNLPVLGCAFDKQMTPWNWGHRQQKQEWVKKIKSLRQSSLRIDSQENKSSNVTAGLRVLSVFLDTHMLFDLAASSSSQ